MVKKLSNVAWLCRCALLCMIAGCSLAAHIPVISDPVLEQMVQREAQPILAVADPRSAAAYRFQLSDFPRRDLLGLSAGRGRIFISYELARRALRDRYHLWVLRQTLAHEIAHEVARHADQGGVVASRAAPEAEITGRDLGLSVGVRFQNYSVEKELQADFEGLRYWARLGWNCGIWVGILHDFETQQYAGDKYHPTERRLVQAAQVCAAPPADQKPARAAAR